MARRINRNLADAAFPDTPLHLDSHAAETIQGGLRIAVLGLTAVAVLAAPVIGQGLGPGLKRAPPEIATASFEYQTPGPILIPVTTAGETGLFLLDTGSTHHALDERYESRLGDALFERTTGTATSTTITVKAFRPPLMLVADEQITSARPVGILDCDPISRTLGQDIHGILGAPILSDYILTVDFDRGLVKLYADGGPSPEAEAVTIPLTCDGGGRPVIPSVVVGGLRLSFLLDTGANSRSITLTTPKFQQLVDRGLITGVDTIRVLSASGVTESRAGILSEMTIGPFAHRQVSVAESRSNKIGMEYLSRFLVTIDLKDRQLHLSKGARSVEHSRPITSGINTSIVGFYPVVRSVDSGSPADGAGVKTGDKLLEVNGVLAVGPETPRALRHLHGLPGTPVRLLFSRDGVDMSASFVIEPYEKWSKTEDLDSEHLQKTD